MRFGGIPIQIALATGALAVLLSGSPAFARGAALKTEPDPAPSSTPSAHGKPVLAIAPVERVRVELPDGEVHDFGADFQARMTTRLTEGGKFVVADPISGPQDRSQNRLRALSPLLPDPYVWSGSYVPAATLRVRVNALSLRTGIRGNRMFYGFDERFRTSFNDGSGNALNEFPVNDLGGSWFGDSFQARGDTFTGTLSGLDLGDGFGLNLLFVWFTVKWAKFQSALRLELEVDAPLAGRHDLRPVSVEGSGYFYDVVAGYEAWGVALQLARRTAMLEAFQQAIEASLSAVDRATEGLPLTAVVDGVDGSGGGGRIFLGTGESSQVAPGVTYESIDHPEVTVQVVQSVSSGSIARLTSGGLAAIREGMIFRERGSGPTPRSIASLAKARTSFDRTGLEGDAVVQETPPVVATESIQLPEAELPEPDLGGSAPQESFLEAYFRSLVETITLPYRIWRYNQYDRAYSAESDDGTPAPPLSLRGDGPVVAILDTGVDYNHPALHASLWLNPEPVKDPSGQQDRYGWDFISGDSRPYDDHSHGTRVASAVLYGNPKARILPLKVFNPWGVTSSAALLAAFRYAVDHGAKVIVCAWATPRQSLALREGIAYAEEHGVSVVVSPRNSRAYPALFASQLQNVIVPDPARARELQGLSFAEPRQGAFRAESPDDPALQELLAGYVAGEQSAAQ